MTAALLLTLVASLCSMNTAQLAPGSLKPGTYFEWTINKATNASSFEKKFHAVPAGAPSLVPKFYEGALYNASVAENANKLLKSNPAGISISQFGQDVVILTILQGKTSGYFVDLAANDYLDISNTYTLDRNFNWSGICIEPNEQYRNGILANRKCKLVTNPVSDKNGDVITFRVSNGAGGGMIGDKMDNHKDENIEQIKHHVKVATDTDKQMITVTLAEILDYFNAPKIIDFMSLDVEGAEINVIQKFPFDRYTFRTLTVERPTKEIHNILIKNNYQWVWEKSTDCIYMHRSMPNLKEMLKKYKTMTRRIPKWRDEPRYYLRDIAK